MQSNSIASISTSSLVLQGTFTACLNRHFEHLHLKSSNYSILPPQNLFYHLYYTILQHFQHPNFYFPILLIKIIFLHNKII